MAPESMVHALEQIHAMLVPDGALIDIHPNSEPVEFHYPLQCGDRLLGYLEESDDYLEYRQADKAVESIVARGLFRMDSVEEFEFRTYADKFDELKGFLEENWSDAIIPAEVIASAHAAEEASGETGVFLRELTKISLLKAL